METILIIPIELKYFEKLVKLVKRRKDAETIQARVATVIRTPNIKRVCINKINHSKTLHLVVEINQALLEGLVDTRALMLVMAANVVKEFGIMHLVSRHETYKIISSIITQALGKITNIPVTMGKVVYQWFSLLLTLTVMTFF
jgi:hypothetical protein